MRRTKQEIEEELTHKQNLIRSFRARLRPLEIQAAQKGMNVPPEILTEISTLTENIRVQEDEISKLETLAAEGQLSIAEAEYRLLLAEAWDTPIGRPTASGAARLELARLRLGLSPERAEELEREIRVQLVEEVFSILDISALLGQAATLLGDSAHVGEVNLTIHAEGESTANVQRIDISQNMTISNPRESALRLVGKAIRLAPQITLDLLIQCLQNNDQLDLTTFEEALFAYNRVWVHQDEYVIFNGFVTDLRGALPAKILPPSTSEEEL